jgi:HK97 family phage prohead protease
MWFYEQKIAPSQREQKHFDCRLEIKQVEENGHFSGYGSVFNRLDSQNDIIIPGAFTETIIDRKSDIKLLWQHDMREPIGIIEQIEEDGLGLFIKGRLLFEVNRAKEAYALMKEGVLTGLSIGYSPVRFKRDPENGTRILEKVDLWEISLVTFPANEAARVTTLKHHCLEEDENWSRIVEAGKAIELSNALDYALSVLMTEQTNEYR